MRHKSDPIPNTFIMPCGGKAIWDISSDISYRCDSCFAVVDSVGMPRHCFELLQKERQNVQQQKTNSK